MPQPGQTVHAPEHPLGIGHVPLFQQIDGAAGGADKVRKLQGGGALFPVLQAAGIVILAGLGHLDEPGGQLLFAHVLGHAMEQRLPDGGEFPQIVPEDLPVGGLCQGVGGESEPLLPALRRARGAGVAPVEEGCAPHAAVVLRQSAVLAPFAQREAPVGPVQGHPIAQIVLIRKPEAEAPGKIVVPGDRVVEAVALRAVAHEAHGDPPLQLGEQLTEHGPSEVLIEGPGLFKSLHRSAPPFPSAPSRRGSSRNSQSWGRIWRW